MRTTSRMPCVDALKAIACLLIVLHHLAFYGPMSDAAYTLVPTLIDLFYQYGRMAVQAFFVVAGFLMAAKFAPHGKALPTQPAQVIYQRYLRLAIPYLVALVCAIVCAALAREWLTHDSIPDAPTWMQLLPHVFFLQDLAGQDALSAGVWYVAIDLQLFSLAALLMWGAGRMEVRYAKLRLLGPIAIALLTAASLFFFNLHKELDTTAFYFFGSYGLGALAYWATRRQDGMWWLALLTTAVMAALLFDFRSRILVAGGVMLMLGIARQTGAMEAMPMPRFLVYLGRISYSVFLIHFPLCMVVNAVFFHFFPEQPAANLIGMMVALAASIVGGALLFKWVESRPLSNRKRLLAPTGFLVSGMLAAQQVS
ncbi:acyltransferase family protein [Herminiimonas fonticola]|uniref:Peptidoglycan/LPS O-acetylase OafA/YrhL n=1 Tax=Herminiimonas fonticola TaxID=303380 RepID=A0A4R6GH46_9BURK|nr:acyltransferase [Herminiimonas fonticola]RBA24523.1 Acyltransferase family [Herminiimonas fonticola]TDN93640.1 peptidoglycan/LPS O-acetylase OafA/YrhL [Herminiimonas fonticola]